MKTPFTHLNDGFFRFLFLVLVTVLFYQCSNQSLTPEPIEIIKDFEVPLEKATLVAQNYNLNSKDSTIKGARKSASKEINTKETVLDSDDKTPLFHIINFSKGGFIIVSADARTIPVLAYSDNGSLDLKDLSQANAVKIWINSAKKQIKDIKKQIKDIHPIVDKMWKENLPSTYTDKGSRSTVNTNCEEWYRYGQFMCKNNYSLARGPLLSTLWGQSGISNFYAPSASSCSCGKDPAGCGPVAIAQVVRYHQPNSSYGYSSMPNGSSYSCTASSYGEMELARLMRDCGTAASSTYHFLFSCNTLTYPWNIYSGLSGMGLSSSGTSSSYNPYVLKNEIMSGNPVIFYAYDTVVNWHIWVCDGWEEHNYDSYDCDTQSCYSYGFSWFHMNYGWGEYSGATGWYNSGVFTPYGTSYNYNSGLTMISNIRK